MTPTEYQQATYPLHLANLYNMQRTTARLANRATLRKAHEAAELAAEWRKAIRRGIAPDGADAILADLERQAGTIANHEASIH
jgi:hypothetical protein